MHKKLSKKNHSLVVAIGLVMILVSCSIHRNPLRTARPKTVVRFLVRASQIAEKKLHVFNAPGGYYYGKCMADEEKRQLCNALYKVMINVARRTPLFQGMTVNDLTDKSDFRHIKADYQRDQFNAV